MTSSWLIEELPPLVSSPKANSRRSGRGTTGMLQTAPAATRHRLHKQTHERVGRTRTGRERSLNPN